MVAVAAVVLLIWMFLSLFAVVVRDETGEVVSARIVSYGRTQQIPRWPGGLFITVSQIGEGTVEIRCRDGSSSQKGYVDTEMSTWLVVEGPGCSNVRELL